MRSHLRLLPVALLLPSLGTAAAFADTYLVAGYGPAGSFSLEFDPSTCEYAKPYCYVPNVSITVGGVTQTGQVVFNGASPGFPDYVSVGLDAATDAITTSTDWYKGGYLAPAPPPAYLTVVPLTIIPGMYDMTGSDLDSGTLTVTDVTTPEPATLGLLSTGVLGGFAALRRRFRNPQPPERT